MNRRSDEDETRFLNVDLDIRSRARLEPLVAAFGDRVCVLYVGPEGKGHGAHLELASFCGKEDANALIRALTTLVRKLPKAARKLWKQAQSREFNIGINAGVKPYSYELRLDSETLDSVARVGGLVVFTVYAAPVRVAGAGVGRGKTRIPPKKGVAAGGTKEAPRLNALRLDRRVIGRRGDDMIQDQANNASSLSDPPALGAPR